MIRTRTLVVACLLGTTAAVACGSSSDEPAAKAPEAPKPVVCHAIGAANEVAKDDPRWDGQCIFLNDTWDTEVYDEWPPADFLIGLMKSEPDVFGNQLEKFGLVRDPADELPIGLKRGAKDRTKLHETCALCHVASLPDGRLWLGLPNGKLDFPRLRVEVNKRWVAAGHSSLLSALDEQKAAEFGPGRTGAESSAYPKPVPADFPAYFSLGQRTHMNYLGTGRNVRTEVYFSLFTFGAGSPDEETTKVPFPPDEKVDTFLSFMGTMAAPAAPAGDAGMIAQGKGVFASASCGTCHHVDDLSKDDVIPFDKDPAGLDRLPGADTMWKKGSIHTDGLHRIIQDGDGMGGGVDPGYGDLISFLIKYKLAVGASEGYRVLDLHGVWATAPYLHNGSVPTVEDLLKKPSERPKTFVREGFTIDTSKPGNGNGGHDFGTDLSDADKAALAAYLKSL